MNTIRLIAIALPMTLLLACGGGGGGIAAAPSTGGGGGPTAPQLQSLPAVLVANTDQTRTRVGGTAPPNLSSADIGRTIRTIAGNADTLLYDVNDATSVTCNRTMCNYDLNEIIHTVSVDEYSRQILGEDMEEELELIGYNENNEAVMSDRGVTIGQRRVAGRVNTEAGVVILEYQMYGGWNEDNHFGIERATVTGGNNPGTEVRTYSFGDASGSNPTTGTLIDYNGVMIGTDTSTNQVVHGDAVIQFVVSNSTVLDTVTFQNIVNLSNGSPVDIINFNNVPLANDGTFESSSGDIKGTFYGANHEEMGGVFDSNNIIGAFGAKR